FFLFSCLSTLSVLLSFPTRRSSDLYMHFFFYGLTQPVKDFINLTYPGNGLSLALLVVITIYRRGFLVIYLYSISDNGLVIDEILDRKSTRLNSSHVKISYAVFCLKK